MQINLNFDSFVDARSDVTQFKAAIEYVASFLDAHFTNNVTMTLDIGSGEIGPTNTAMPGNALGETEFYYGATSYSNIVKKLMANETTGDDTLAVNSLLSTSSFNAGTHTYTDTSNAPVSTVSITSAQSRALGLSVGTNTPDAYVGFATGYGWAYNESAAPTGGSFDLVGTALHEFTEAMGRISGVGTTIGNTVMDLFRFSSAGTRDLTAGDAPYFSINNGTTDLGQFNPNSGGDSGDWAASVGNDSFLAFSSPNVLNPVAANDMTVMDTLGWNYVNAAPTAGTINLSGAPGATVSGNLITAGQVSDPNGDLVRFSAGTGTNVGLHGALVLGGDGAYDYTPAGGLVLAVGASVTDGFGFGVTDGLSSAVAGTIEVTLTGSATGAAGADTLLANDAGDSLSGLGGDDSLIGGTGDDTLDGGLGDDTMAGGAGNDVYVVDSAGDLVVEAVGAGTDTVLSSVTYTLPANVENLTLTGSSALAGTGNSMDNLLTANSGADTLSGGGGDDTFIGGGGDDLLIGSGSLDIAEFPGNRAAYAITAAGGTVEVTNIGSGSVDRLVHIHTAQFADGNAIACYLRGTRIMTTGGERQIEHLAIGDIVLTAAGAAKPIRWIGRRAYAAADIAANPPLRPVVVRRDAIAPGVPRRDLSVSALHALLVDGALVPAAALVNGRSIVRREEALPTEYFHLELDDHDILLAEGMPAESFIDEDSRWMFSNCGEHVAGYGDVARPPSRVAPRLDEGEELARITARLAARAGLAAAPAVPGGPPIGHVERLVGSRIEGWVTDPSGLPGIEVEVLLGGVSVCRAPANRYRTDLDRAGLAGGRCGFTIRLPCLPRDGEALEVRRRSDGAPLAISTSAPG